MEKIIFSLFLISCTCSLFSQSDNPSYSQGTSFVKILRQPGGDYFLKAGASGTLPFSNGTTLSFRSIATGDLPDLGATYWKLGGNTITAEDSIGAKDNNNVIMIQNNLERLSLESGFTRLWDNSGNIIGQFNANTGTTDWNVPDNTADAYEGYILGGGSDGKWLNFSSTTNNNFLTVGTGNPNSKSLFRADYNGLGNGVVTPQAPLHLSANDNIAAIPIAGEIKGYKIKTERNNFTDTLTAASGSATGVVVYDFKPDTIAATNSNVTHQNAYNVRIDGPPVAGTNVTITNPGGLWVDAGRSRFDDQIMLANSGVGGFPQLAFNGGLDTGFGLQSGLLQVVYNDSSAIRINNFGEVGINDDPTSGWALTVNATDGTGDGAVQIIGNQLHTLYNNEGPAFDINYFDSDGSGLAEDVFKVNTSNGSERIILGEDGGVMKTLIHQQLDKVSSEVTTTTTATLGEILLVNCSGGVVEIDVPTSPSAGDWFAVSDTRGNAGTSNVTVDFTGATVNLHASSQDYIMNVNNGFVRFTYVDATVGWIITGEKN